MTTSTFLTLAASQPAGGAAIGQIIIATAGAMVVTALLLWLGFGHRSGKVAAPRPRRGLRRARLGPARLGRAARPASRPSR